MFAGLQLAFSDAIRVDDVVVVEQEWGRIEEITMTYVVVHLWDDRRLIMPSTYFTTTPFENWTRRGSELLGSVELDLGIRHLEQLVIGEYDVVDVIRAAPGLDDVHVDVLRLGARGITAGTYGLECVSAIPIGADPPAQPAMTISWEDPRLDFECNTLGTFNVLEAARAKGIPTTVRDTRGREIDGACGQLAATES